jgi:uncharacterized protein (TIRG00374 family)
VKRWRVWIGVAVSAVAIAWAARGVDWSAFAAALGEANWLLLGVVFLLSPIVNIVIRAIRWRILLMPVVAAPLSRLLSATAIGLMANNVLPARIGEFVRAYALGKHQRMAVGTAFGSLFVERMFDGFALVAILYVLTWIHPLPEWVDTTAGIAFWIFVGFLAFQLVLASRPEAFIRFAGRLTRRPFGGRLEEPLGRALVTFVDGFRLLRRPWLAGLSFVLAIVQWAAIAALFRLSLAAFGLAAATGWEAAYFTTAVSALGVAVPSSPGFVGTFQAFVVEALDVFGIDRSAALGFAVGHHVVSYVSVTLVGVAAFLRAGWTWRDLERSEERVERELEQELASDAAPRPDHR